MQDWIKKVEEFKSSAHKILGVHEESSSRIVSLRASYASLKSLNLKQDDLFKQAFTCLEKGCFRASHVMAWAAFMDFIEEKFFEDGGQKLKISRPAWKTNSVEDFREGVNEFQIIEAIEIVGLCTKTERKALQGLLNKRNECAHPNDYFPELNDTLGYITELIRRIKNLKNKHI
ncbi:MAG: hypothetical protein WC735_04870 [Candidatus Paceibacterota bacterium]|jgi:hypothetical protein